MGARGSLIYSFVDRALFVLSAWARVLPSPSGRLSRVRSPWQRLLPDSCSSCGLGLEVKGEVQGKQVSPLCKCSLGGSEHLAVERGRRAPGERRWRSPREPRWLIR